ncbi:hypothetical protein [Treponema sp.]|uniref:hypothetical protein n=1 Tax=Treponema sp. TaxID=166 RepID=UPI003F0070FB
MINTLNETSLHKSLKAMYRIQCSGQAEAQAGPYIADIISPNGEIIEIQTGTLGKLLKKAEFFLSENRRIKIVYPLITLKHIETFDSATGKTTSRKSPVKKNIYSIFREITALVPVLLKKNFTLEIVEAEITEERIKTQEPVQSKNGRRRFKKNWQKTGKRLEQTGRIFTFSGKDSYTKLLPRNLPANFTVRECLELLQEENSGIKKSDISLMIWVLEKTGIIYACGKKGNAKVYSLPHAQ